MYMPKPGNPDQGVLFSEGEPVPFTPDVDSIEIPTPPTSTYEPRRRVSEAAADQGWGGLDEVEVSFANPRELDNTGSQMHDQQTLTERDRDNGESGLLTIPGTLAYAAMRARLAERISPKKVPPTNNQGITARYLASRQQRVPSRSTKGQSRRHR
jgi:hypothetical protein